LSFGGWWAESIMPNNDQADQARQTRRKTLVLLAVLSGVAAILATAALFVLSVRPGVPELIPGQQRPPPVVARIRL
jgi:hypothetical protein